MKNKAVLLANFKRHKVAMLGIFTIMLIVSLSLISVLSIWWNTNTYLEKEMERMRYGDLTAWTGSIPDIEEVLTEIKQLPDVADVSRQHLIYSDYEIFDQHSDSEGQLIVYEPQTYPYRMFNEHQDGYRKDAVTISPKEIYISPALFTDQNIQIGDWISFPIGRQGNVATFQIKGTFEDPFMGSSMIGMKSFLISQEDYDEIKGWINEAGIDALAREGSMIHIEQTQQSGLSSAQFNQLLNEQTSLGEHVEFMHSKDAISGFMLILQNAFAGLSLAFSLILLLVSLLIISYSITTTLEQDRNNMSSLKTIGYDGAKLRALIRQQYLFVILSGFVCGAGASLCTVPLMSRLMVSFSGILTPAAPQIALWVVLLIMIIVFFCLFIEILTMRINAIRPINILQIETAHETKGGCIALQKQFLLLRISLRQLMSGRKRYLSISLTALLLVFITSMIGRMNSWLGPDGKGMMDAFHPADLDIGVQLMSNQNIEEVEQLIQQYTSIEDSYELAMPNVSVNGVDHSANVITEPERFHIQKGNTSQSANEIVITETAAEDLDIGIDDLVTLAYNGKSASYTVSGIYQCANDMGSNIGISREGFLRIGMDTPSMWCHHYFLERPDQKQIIIDALSSHYGGDVYVHENTWPGLFSIIAAMKALLVVMYVMTTFFILIVTIMTGRRIFLFEKRNLSLYKTLGYTSTQLRTTFAIRYGISAGIGSLAGILLSALLTDQIVKTMMKLYGISNFASHPDLITMLLPAMMVSTLFVCFAYLTSGSMTKLELKELLSE